MNLDLFTLISIWSLSPWVRTENYFESPKTELIRVHCKSFIWYETKIKYHIHPITRQECFYFYFHSETGGLSYIHEWRKMSKKQMLFTYFFEKRHQVTVMYLKTHLSINNLMIWKYLRSKSLDFCYCCHHSHAQFISLYMFRATDIKQVIVKTERKREKWLCQETELKDFIWISKKIFSLKFSTARGGSSYLRSSLRLK